MEKRIILVTEFEPLTIECAANDFIADFCAAKNTKSNFYRLGIEKLLAYFGRTRQMQSITESDLDEFKQTLIEIYKPATCNSYITASKVFFKKLHEKYPKLKNVAQHLSRIKFDLSEPKSFSDEQITKIENYLLKEKNNFLRTRNYAFWRTMLLTGLRVSEVLSIKMDNIDFDKKIIYQLQTKGSYVRNVSFPSLLLSPLKDYLNYREKSLSNSYRLYAKSANKGEYPLFIKNFPTKFQKNSPEAYGLNRSTIKCIFNKIKSNTNIPAHPHKLRHTFGYKFMSLTNGNVRLTAQAMGLRSADVVLRYTVSPQTDIQKILELF